MCVKKKNNNLLAYSSVHSLWHGFGSPVKNVASQEAFDQGELSLFPAQLLNRLHYLQIVFQRRVILLLLNLQTNREYDKLDQSLTWFNHLKIDTQMHTDRDWNNLIKRKQVYKI